MVYIYGCSYGVLELDLNVKKLPKNQLFGGNDEDK